MSKKYGECRSQAVFGYTTQSEAEIRILYANSHKNETHVIPNLLGYGSVAVEFTKKALL